MKSKKILFVAACILLITAMSSYAEEKSLYLAQFNKGIFNILKLSLDGKQESIILSKNYRPQEVVINKNSDFIAISRGDRDNIKYNIILLDIKSEKTVEMPDTGASTDISFVNSKDWLVYSKIIEDKTKPKNPYSTRIEIYDYKNNKVIKTIQDGYGLYSSILDSSFYFLRFVDSKNTIEIYCYDTDKNQLTKKQSIKVVTNDDSTGGPYDITEVVGLSKDEFYFRVYDEHEYRYYGKDFKTPFYSEVSKGFNPKEQYNLTFAKDGKGAVLAERNWNQLTYIIYFDLYNKKNIVTNYYGSFPVISYDKVYFISDPSFVKPQNKDFKQIKSYALYCYDPKSNILTEMKRYQGQIQIVNSK